MDDFTKKKITHNLAYIKESICDDLDTFVDGLIEQDIFEIDIKEKLNSVETAKGKSDKLICMILNKGPIAIGAFIGLLRKKRYTHVLRKMDEETEGAVVSEISVGDSLDQLLIVKGIPVKEGARGEPMINKQLLANIPIHDVAASETSQYECLQKNYTVLQNAYGGLREQLVKKQDQLSHLNREKIAMDKALKEVKKENQSLLIENVNLKEEEKKLKSDIQNLERSLQQKSREILDIEQKIGSMEEMLNEERGCRQRMEMKVDDQSKMLMGMSEVLQKLAVKFDCTQGTTEPNSTHETAGTNNTQDINKTQRSKQTMLKSSHKNVLNKTNSSGKKK